MRRLRLSVLSFDARRRLFYWPDALVTVGPKGRFEELRPLKGKAPNGVLDRRGLLAIPGLIDAHCHLPQYPAVASGGLELLPWLKKHIFPLEASFRGEKSRPLARRFFSDMAGHGTTTACVYTSIWKDSTEICFEEAERSGLRVIMGKVMMDRFSYDTKLRTRLPGESRLELSLSESETLCRRWHGADGGRLRYAFTPRFALSCSEPLMRGAADLAERYGAYVQTHLSENKSELLEVRKAFPRRRDYAEVYARAGILGPKTVLAHSIWLSDSERKTIARSGAVVAHCPTSNAFLSSGIMDHGALKAAGIPLALGSDVAAGPSLCLFEAMRQAVSLQRVAAAHALFKGSNTLTPAEAFYMASLGGARALGLGGETGSLEKGKDADFVLIDPALYDTGGPAQDAESVLSRLVYRAGRFAVKAAFVRGRLVSGPP